jgi:2-polyprenyl-3-methyl-5-hydroxy-6-metoxy-1,4-benzoquinol methylase
VIIKTSVALNNIELETRASYLDFSDIELKMVVSKGALVHRFGDYYNGERPDLEKLIPEGVKSILDIGTAMGGYGRGLKRNRPDVVITGVEMNPEMAELATKYYDHFYACKFEQLPQGQIYDMINCGDIIEHLYNPWEAFNKINQLLKPKGYLVLSVPNVGHWTIVADLLNGKFEYIPVGLQCITHIRWFTETSIKQALNDSGFEIDVFERQQHPPTDYGKGFIKKLVNSQLGDGQSLLTNEFVIRARKK